MKPVLQRKADRTALPVCFLLTSSIFLKGNTMSSNLSLSFELICLMGWLLKHDKEKLKLLVKEAVEHGLAGELDNINSADYLAASDQMHTTIEDFMEYLENLLIESVEGADVIEADIAARDTLMATVKKIDNQTFDNRTLWLSMQQAKSQLIKKMKAEQQSSEEQEAKLMLFDQLLKNWSPSNNEQMN